MNEALLISGTFLHKMILSETNIIIAGFIIPQLVLHQILNSYVLRTQINLMKNLILLNMSWTFPYWKVAKIQYIYTLSKTIIIV